MTQAGRKMRLAFFLASWLRWVSNKSESPGNNRSSQPAGPGLISIRIPPTHACRLRGRAELSPIVMSKLERIEKVSIIMPNFTFVKIELEWFWPRKIQRKTRNSLWSNGCVEIASYFCQQNFSKPLSRKRMEWQVENEVNIINNCFCP